MWYSVVGWVGHQGRKGREEDMVTRKWLREQAEGIGLKYVVSTNRDDGCIRHEIRTKEDELLVTRCNPTQPVMCELDMWLAGYLTGMSSHPA